MRGVGGLRPPCPEMTVKSAHAPCSCAAGQLLGHRGSEMGGSAAVDDHDTVCREEIKPAQHFHGNAARRSWCTSSGISLPDFMGTGWWGPAVPRPHGGSRGHRHGPRTGRGRENPGLRPAPLTTPASGLAVPEESGGRSGSQDSPEKQNQWSECRETSMPRNGCWDSSEGLCRQDPLLRPQSFCR